MTDPYAQHLVDASGEALAALTPAGAILSWSAGAEHIFQVARTVAVGQLLHRLVLREEDGELFLSALDETRSTGSAVLNAVGRRKDGVEIDLEVVMRREGEWICFAAADVSERSRLTRELMEKRWVLEAEARRLAGELVGRERLAAIGGLASGVAHDLRNPLAAVRNATNYISRKLGALPHSDPRIPQFIKVMEQELAVCEERISGLLDFASDRAPSPTLCSLPPLVREAVDQARPPEHVEVVTYLREDLPLLELDVARIRRVLINLVRNACEAIPTSRRGKVTIGVTVDEAWLTIRVADDGVGIAPDILDKIYDPLFTTKARGTGLGLAVVARIVRDDGGEVRAESRVGTGTTFEVRFQRRR